MTHPKKYRATLWVDPFEPDAALDRALRVAGIKRSQLRSELQTHVLAALRSARFMLPASALSLDEREMIGGLVGVRVRLRTRATGQPPRLRPHRGHAVDDGEAELAQYAAWLGRATLLERYSGLAMRLACEGRLPMRGRYTRKRGA